MQIQPIEKIYSEEDIYGLMDYLKTVDLKDQKKVFVNPYSTSDSFNEINLRDGFFKYRLLACPMEESDKLEGMALFLLPDGISLSKCANLQLLAELDNNKTKDFLKRCIAYIKKEFPEISKLRCSMLAGQKGLEFFEEVGFQHEITLKNELGINKHVSYYSMILE